ncbi:MAG: PEGA domain-containing protein, partial [Bacteroidota bacterium]
QRVRVSRSDATLRYQLDPVRVGATLVLTTAPVGVEVVLNEEVLGETPFRAFFDPGLVEFELRKDGFRPRNIVVEIPESGTVRRTDSLSLARSRLDLIADREALVVLDGDTLGLSPQEALGREPSTYAVWFLAPGFDPHVEYVVLSEPGEVREITATLSAPGSDVQVVAEPEGTQVLLDGVLLGPAPVRLRVPPGTYDVSVQSAEGLMATRPDPLVVEVGGGATDIAVRLGPGSEAVWVLGDELPALEPLPPAEPEPTVAAEELQEAADTSPSPPPAPEPARWVVRLESDDRYPVQGGDTVLDEYVACVQENVPEDLSEPVRVALLIQTNRRGRVTETPTVVRGNEGWLVARATQCLRLLTFESEAADVFYDIEVVQE